MDYSISSSSFNTCSFLKAKVVRALKDRFDSLKSEALPINVFKDTQTYMRLYIPDQMCLNGIKQFDLDVLDSVFTISDSGLDTFTMDMLYRVLCGNPKARITEKSTNAIMRSINIFRNIRIEIDCTDEAFKRGIIEKNKELILSSSILPIMDVVAQHEVNGTSSEAMYLYETPAIFTYCRLTKQIVSMPIEALRVNCNNSIEAITIKRHVLKRIGEMLGKNSLSNNSLSYIWKTDATKGMLPELGYVDVLLSSFRKRQMPRISKIVLATLNKLVELEIIDEFKPYRKDGTNNPASPVMGYKISFNNVKTKEGQRKTS